MLTFIDQPGHEKVGVCVWVETGGLVQYSNTACGLYRGHVLVTSVGNISLKGCLVSPSCPVQCLSRVPALSICLCMS